MPSSQKKSGYPQLDILSKYDLLERLVSKKMPFEKAKALTLELETNKDSFWFDHGKMSKPKEKKFVRCVKKHSGLSLYLRLINQDLRVWDSLLPINVYGGRTNRSAIDAAANLLVNQGKNRFLLKTDLSRFFEQVDKGRIFSFFKNKCGCSKNASDFMAKTCTVPEGAKDDPGPRALLARGFSPSTRLATWCNVEFFYRLIKTVNSHFKDRKIRPQIIIYVDDIFISASNTDELQMDSLKEKILDLAPKFNLEINKSKTIVYTPEEIGKTQEALGVILNRKSIRLPLKWRQKVSRLKQEKQKAKTYEQKKAAKLKIKGLYLNKAQVQKANKALEVMRRKGLNIRTEQAS